MKAIAGGIEDVILENCTIDQPPPSNLVVYNSTIQCSTTT